jgi:hypothetical protein
MFDKIFAILNISPANSQSGAAMQVDNGLMSPPRLPVHLVAHFFPKVLAIFMVLAGLAVVSPLACAHHGSSAYDFSKLITLKATVTSLEWGNPHCILHFDSKDEKGAITPWSLEMYNPLWMARAGWNKATLKPGDEIVVTFHPSKNAGGNGFIRIPESKIVFHGQPLNLDENGSASAPPPPAN